MRSGLDVRGAHVAALTMLAGGLALARPAAAQGLARCQDLPNVVYLQIGDTQAPLIKELGRALRDNGDGSLTLVYVTSGSCVNIGAIYNDTRITTNLFFMPSLSANPAWTPAQAPLQCTPPTGGALADIANSNVFISACDPSPVPADIAVYHGPVQAYVLAVPEASHQVAITAEEAYFVFGFGHAGAIVPWDDETQMFGRTNTKSTLLSWAYNLGVLPVTKWKGVRFDGSPQVVDALQHSPTPVKAIGILGAEVYDQYRATLDVLAFRSYGQTAAYYPDSTASSLDKRNVRDGHYTVWSPTIYMTRQTGGVPDDARARYVIDLIVGRTPVGAAPRFNATSIVMHNGLVPDCAMHVQRSSEGGNLSMYTPAEDCTCFFEKQTATTSCRSCETTAECTANGGSGVCRNHLCEAR